MTFYQFVVATYPLDHPLRKNRIPKTFDKLNKILRWSDKKNPSLREHLKNAHRLWRSHCKAREEAVTNVNA